MSVDVPDLYGVVQFLTSFQDYFQDDDKVLEGEIEMEYQEFHEKATCTWYVLSLTNGIMGRDQNLRSIKNMVAQLQDHSQVLKFNYHMLQSFDV